MTILKESYYRIRADLLQWPLLNWILLGFFITFFFFFIGPIFLDSSHVMQFKHYVFILHPIATDFRVTVASSSTWLHTGVYVATEWPPFTTIFLAPFTLMGPETGYHILLFVIVSAFIFITLTIPRWINKTRDMSPFAMLIFLTGIVSYGFQFELERGQFNVIAFACCLTAIYLFHNRPRSRWAAYILFSIAVQWKLYPAIFVLALIDDWSDWKNNLKRVLGLGLLNLLLLFILGVHALQDTLAAFARDIDLQKGHAYNLSVSSFSYYILRLHWLPDKRVFLWLTANPWILQVFLLVLFLLGFLIIVWQAYKSNARGLNPYVCLACTVGACVIPSLSYDYKLSLLPPVVALVFPGILSFKDSVNRPRTIALAFLFSLAYSSTLYSFTNKPPVLQNNLPALFVIMLCTVLACVTSGEKPPASIGAKAGDSDDQSRIEDRPATADADHMHIEIMKMYASRARASDR